MTADGSRAGGKAVGDGAGFGRGGGPKRTTRGPGGAHATPGATGGGGGRGQASRDWSSGRPADSGELAPRRAGSASGRRTVGGGGSDPKALEGPLQGPGGRTPRSGATRSAAPGQSGPRQAGRTGDAKKRGSGVAGERADRRAAPAGSSVDAPGRGRESSRPGRGGAASASAAWSSGGRGRSGGQSGVRGREGASASSRREDLGRPRPLDTDERSGAPLLPESVVAADLDRAARGRLRTLSKDNADAVARHLVMAGRLLEEDPEVAYAHAQEAVRRAGRVDVVREAAGITAYRVGRYAEALRELRTARRLNGSDEHVALMADCERGLGRPERALALAHEHAGDLSGEARVEMAIVASGARLDLGDPEAALAELSAPALREERAPLSWRIDEARAAALSAGGRAEEAAQILAALPAEAFGPEEVEVVDLEEDDSEDDGAGLEKVPGQDGAEDEARTDGAASGRAE